MARSLSARTRKPITVRPQSACSSPRAASSRRPRPSARRRSAREGDRSAGTAATSVVGGRTPVGSAATDMLRLVRARTTARLRQLGSSYQPAPAPLPVGVAACSSTGGLREATHPHRRGGRAARRGAGGAGRGAPVGRPDPADREQGHREGARVARREGRADRQGVGPWPAREVPDQRRVDRSCDRRGHDPPHGRAALLRRRDAGDAQELRRQGRREDHPVGEGRQGPREDPQARRHAEGLAARASARTCAASPRSSTGPRRRR